MKQTRRSDTAVALAGSGSALFLAWMENTGRLHLAHIGDGTTFTDSVTTALARTSPLLTSDDDQADSTLLFGWCDRTAAGSPSVARIDVAAPFDPHCHTKYSWVILSATTMRAYRVRKSGTRASAGV